jgi:hypothetical protein
VREPRRLLEVLILQGLRGTVLGSVVDTGFRGAKLLEISGKLKIGIDSMGLTK